MTTLGKYTLQQPLGRGGYGTVYLAEESVLKVQRAVKLLHPALTADPSFIERFRHEAQVAARLEHPHIVPVYELSEDQGRYYLAMKYMPGGSLKDLLAKERRLPYERALQITKQVASALDFAHGQGLVHRDVKPGNILFEKDGTARLADFGFSKAMHGATSASLSATGGMIGTPQYMAPELWSGKPATPATDVYSLACVLYEMLSGEVLFGGESPAEIMKRHVLDGPQLPQKWPSGVPNGFEGVLRRALAMQVEARSGTAGEFIRELEELEKVQPNRSKAVLDAHSEPPTRVEKSKESEDEVSIQPTKSVASPKPGFQAGQHSPPQQDDRTIEIGSSTDTVENGVLEPVVRPEGKVKSQLPSLQQQVMILHDVAAERLSPIQGGDAGVKKWSKLDLLILSILLVPGLYILIKALGFIVMTSNFDKLVSFNWYLNGFYDLGGWVFFFLYALISLMLLFYDIRKREIKNPLWKMAILISICLYIPSFLYSLSYSIDGGNFIYHKGNSLVYSKDLTGETVVYLGLVGGILTPIINTVYTFIYLIRSPRKKTSIMKGFLVSVTILVFLILGFKGIVSFIARTFNPCDGDSSPVTYDYAQKISEIVSFDVQFSPDGDLIAYSSWPPQKIEIIKSDDFSTVFKEYSSISSLKFSQSGDKLAYGNENGELCLVNIDNSFPVNCRNVHSFGLSKYYEDRANVTDIAFSPDGKYIVSAGADWRVHIFDSEINHLYTIIQDNFIEALAIDPSSHQLAVSVGYTNDRENLDRATYIYDLGTGKEITKLSYPYEDWQNIADSLVYSDDGRFLITGNFTGAYVWDMTNFEVVSELDGSWGAFDMAFSPINNQVAIGTYDKAQVWDIESGKSVRTFCIPAELSVNNDYSKMEISNALTGHFSSLLDRGIVYGIDYSPDGKSIITATGSGLYLWDIDR